MDVTVEKPDVKQTGDAWRVVIDSCLSVLHLIDTKRSIPYSIKQVQELLGLSCAFEQAVQVLNYFLPDLKNHMILLSYFLIVCVRKSNVIMLFVFAASLSFSEKGLQRSS